MSKKKKQRNKTILIVLLLGILSVNASPYGSPASYPFRTCIKEKKEFFPKLFQTGQIDFPTCFQSDWTKKMEFEKVFIISI